jgi:hypothetical protein
VVTLGRAAALFSEHEDELLASICSAQARTAMARVGIVLRAHVGDGGK